MGEQRTGNVNQRKGMIRFHLKGKRRQQMVLGRHLKGLQETLYKLTDELVIFQSQYQETNEQLLMDLLLILLLNSQENLHPHHHFQVLNPTTPAPMMKAICQVLPPTTSAPMTNAIKLKRVTTMLQQKIAKPKT